MRRSGEPEMDARALLERDGFGLRFILAVGPNPFTSRRPEVDGLDYPVAFGGEGEIIEWGRWTREELEAAWWHLRDDLRAQHDPPGPGLRAFEKLWGYQQFEA